MIDEFIPLKWVPSLYFAMGLPFVVLNMVAAILYEARTLAQPLSFLEPGVTYIATIYADMPDSAENPENYRIDRRTVTAADTLEIAMAARGGMAVTFIPKNE